MRHGLALAVVALAPVIGLSAWYGRLDDVQRAGGSAAGPAPAGTPGEGLLAYPAQGTIMLIDPTTGERREMVPDLRDLSIDLVGSDCLGESGDAAATVDLAWSPDSGAPVAVVQHPCAAPWSSPLRQTGRHRGCCSTNAPSAHGGVSRSTSWAGRPTAHSDARTMKSQVAFRRRRGFAYLWFPVEWARRPGVEVVLSVALGREDDSARWKQVAHPAARIWMHHLEVTRLGRPRR